jgi:N-methylhydantoinase B
MRRDGETILSFSTGGGGFGRPEEREVERVRHDVHEGWMTQDRAERIYGVVIRSDGSVDLEATKERRSMMQYVETAS